MAPALGVEAFGVGEEAGVALGDPLEQEEVGFSGDAVAVEFEVVDGAAAGSEEYDWGVNTGIRWRL